MFKNTFAAALAFGLATLAAPAAAAPAPVPASVTVATGDLDLASQAGIETLEERLKAAVRDVCGLRPSSRDLIATNYHRECAISARFSYREEVRLALADIKERRLAAMAERLTVIGGL